MWHTVSLTSNAMENNNLLTYIRTYTQNKYSVPKNHKKEVYSNAWNAYRKRNVSYILLKELTVTSCARNKRSSEESHFGWWFGLYNMSISRHAMRLYQFHIHFFSSNKKRSMKLWERIILLYFFPYLLLHLFSGLVMNALL